MKTDTQLRQDLQEVVQRRTPAGAAPTAPKVAPHPDSDIAGLVNTALERISFAREAGIRAVVQGGWVTLTGGVERQYQKQVAEEAVRFILGVAGVRNQLVVKP